AGRAEAQTQTPSSSPQAPRPPVFKHELPNVTMDDWEVTVSYVDYPPGRVGTAHHHPGFVLAYVLEGSVVTKISGQGEEKTSATPIQALRRNHCETSILRCKYSHDTFVGVLIAL